MKPKGILFDLDGVLWYSVDAHRLAFQKAFNLMGVPWKFSHRSFFPYSGMTTEKALLEVLHDRHVRWDEKKLKRFGTLKRQWAVRYLRRIAKIHPRLKSTLRQLSPGCV